jgi:hypothetical protein
MSTKTVHDELSNSNSERIDQSVKGMWDKALTVEWLGQTAASLFWIASVFTYGISSIGDWLQLLAASAWLVANIASLTNSVTTD